MASKEQVLPSESERERRSSKEKSSTCAFCLRSEDDPGIDAFENEDLCWFHDPKDDERYITCHDECVLFASGIDRKRASIEYDQVAREVRRCARLRCQKCGLGWASVGCVDGKCHRSFHYPCLVEMATSEVPKAVVAYHMCAVTCSKHMDYFGEERRSTLGELLKVPPSWAIRWNSWKRLVARGEGWKVLRCKRQGRKVNERDAREIREELREKRSRSRRSCPRVVDQITSEPSAGRKKVSKNESRSKRRREEDEDKKETFDGEEENHAVEALREVQPGEVCSLCRLGDRETAELLGSVGGEMFALWIPEKEERVVLHESCARTCTLFSRKNGGIHWWENNLGQRPRAKDIGRVLSTTKSWNCGLCRRGNATLACIGVSTRKCNSYYHIPCITKLASRNRAYLGDDLSCACKYHKHLVKDANEGYVYAMNKSNDMSIEAGSREDRSSIEGGKEGTQTKELQGQRNSELEVKRQQAILRCVLSSVLEEPLPSFSPILEDPGMVRILVEHLHHLQEAQFMASLSGTENLACWNEAQSWDEEVQRAKGILGYREFRPGQQEVINATLAGHDVLVIWPTGGGKSLLFQLPCAMQEAGVTLVLVPLRALASQHLHWLNNNGIQAVWLDGFGGEAEAQIREKEVLEDVLSPASGIRCLLATPEKIMRNAGVRDALKFLSKAGRLRRIVFDECHVLLEWSNTFKPDYAKLAGLREELGMPPILALTAAPVYKDRADLCKLLGSDHSAATGATSSMFPSAETAAMHHQVESRRGGHLLGRGVQQVTDRRWQLFCRSTRRDNLRFEVWPKPIDKRTLAWQLTDYLKHLQQNPTALLGAMSSGEIEEQAKERMGKDRRKALSGLVFVSTRKETHEVAGLLAEYGLTGVAAYHGRDSATMTGLKQEKLMQLWQSGKLPVLVTTPALGLGVDKPDVRFVVHWCIPGSLRSLLQESGRAGRDGKPALALLLYSFSDTQVHEALILAELQKAAASIAPFINSSTRDPPVSGSLSMTSVSGEYGKRRAELMKVVEYAENMLQCRKKVLEGGLEDGLAPACDCGAGCDVCTPRDENNMVTTKNVTFAAISIVKLLSYTGPITRNILLSVLSGRRTSEVRALIPKDDQGLLGCMAKQAGVSEFVLERTFVRLLLDGVIMSTFQPNPSELGSGCTKFSLEPSAARQFVSKYMDGDAKYEISYWNPHETDDNDDICAICGEFGELFCCDGDQCSKAYHLECLSLSDRPEEGLGEEDIIWLCPVCTSGSAQVAASRVKSGIGRQPQALILQKSVTFSCVEGWSCKEMKNAIRSLPQFNAYVASTDEKRPVWRWDNVRWKAAMASCGVEMLDSWVQLDGLISDLLSKKASRTLRAPERKGSRTSQADGSRSKMPSRSTRRWFLCWWHGSTRVDDVSFVFFDARAHRMFSGSEVVKFAEQKYKQSKSAEQSKLRQNSTLSGSFSPAIIFQAAVLAVQSKPEVLNALRKDTAIVSRLEREIEGCANGGTKADSDVGKEAPVGCFEREREWNIKRNQGYLDQLLGSVPEAIEMGATDQHLTLSGEVSSPDVSGLNTKSSPCVSNDSQDSKYRSRTLDGGTIEPEDEAGEEERDTFVHQHDNPTNAREGPALTKIGCPIGIIPSKGTTLGNPAEADSIPIGKEITCDESGVLKERGHPEGVMKEADSFPKQPVNGCLTVCTQEGSQKRGPDRQEQSPSKSTSAKKRRIELVETVNDGSTINPDPIPQKSQAALVQMSVAEISLERRDIALAEALGLMLPAHSMPSRLHKHMGSLTFRQRFLLEEICSKAGWEAIDLDFLQEWLRLAASHGLDSEDASIPAGDFNPQSSQDTLLLPNLMTSSTSENDRRRLGLLILRRFLEEAVAKHSAVGKAKLRAMLTSVVDSLKESNSKTWQNKRFADMEVAGTSLLLDEDGTCGMFGPDNSNHLDHDDVLQQSYSCTPESCREMYSAIYRAGKLHLAPVLCRTKGCRAFRKYGCSRFLFLKLPTKSSKYAESLLGTPLRIAGRKFEFVFGKPLDETAVFFATEGHGIPPDSKCSVEQFRCWAVPLPLPKLSSLAFGKYASRFELCFSESDPAVLIPQEEVIFIDDDDTEHDKDRRREARTDGCGLMRDDLADEVADALGIGIAPSAVQARWGGCKGVWLVIPSTEWHYGDDKRFAIRASQVKYSVESKDSFHITLDVLMTVGARGSRRSSNRSVGRLTKQTVPLLAHKNVPIHTLLDLQAEALKDIESRLLGPPKAIVEELRNADGPLATEALSMVLAGFDPGTSPHLRKMLLRLVEKRKSAIRDHKIPVALAQTVLIVPDPYRVLGAGEVYLNSSQRKLKSAAVIGDGTVRTSGRQSSHVGPIVGEVVLFRSPAHLPEDIVPATAVRCPALKSFEDILVVNVIDEVSIAQRLSGGDYDGDHAVVIWDPRITSPVHKCYAQNSLPKLVTEEEMLKHAVLGRDRAVHDGQGGDDDFIRDASTPMEYVLADSRPTQPSVQQVGGTAAACKLHCTKHLWIRQNVGEVDILHRIAVDRFGPASPMARKLAARARMALDAAKHGGDAQPPPELRNMLFKGDRPHFMPKQQQALTKKGSTKSSGIYHSRSVLGQMYDCLHPGDPPSITRLASSTDVEGRLIQDGPDASNALDEDLLVQGHDKYLALARRLKVGFYRSFRDSLGEIPKDSRRMARYQRLRSEAWNMARDASREQFRSSVHGLEDAVKLASACYRVGVTSSDGSPEEHLFHWAVAGEFLERIKADAVAFREKGTISHSVTRLR